MPTSITSSRSMPSQTNAHPPHPACFIRRGVPSMPHSHLTSITSFRSMPARKLHENTAMVVCCR